MRGRGGKRGFRWGVGLGGALMMAACLPLLPAAGRAEPEGKALQVVATYPLPAGRSAATDVRWASDDSVFVSRADDGVFEITLGENGKATKKRQPVPERNELGQFFEFSRLAVSSRDLVVSSMAFTLTWRPADLQTGGTVDFERRSLGTIADIDARGDRLALLGLPHNDLEKFAGNPGVLWVGSLSKKLEDFRALLRDDTTSGVEGSYLFRCYALDMGSVRFLPNGSLLAVPGFQPGAYLYGPDGRQLRAWTNQELGIDSGCTGVDLAKARIFPDQPATRRAWYDRSRIVDDILPLPQGPGLLIRSVGRDGQARWTLKVLGPKRVTTYELPLTGRSPFERLRGDVRNGKILLLRTVDNMSLAGMPDFQGEILVATLPAGSARQGGH